MTYNLSVGGYSGDIGDGMLPANGMKFSTIDQDNDDIGADCAGVFKGAWW